MSGPLRLWYWPGNARRSHLFSVRETSARSFCGKHSANAKWVQERGHKSPPEHDACLTCLRELELTATRLRGAR